MSDMSHDHAHSSHKYLDTLGSGSALLAFLVVAVIVLFFLVFFKPEFVQRKEGKDCQPTGELDFAVALLAALVITVVIFVILWLLFYAAWC